MSSESNDRDVAERDESSNDAVSRGESREVDALIAIQDALYDRPGVLPTARALSHFGEHSLGWLAISGIGYACLLYTSPSPRD